MGLPKAEPEVGMGACDWVRDLKEQEGYGEGSSENVGSGKVCVDGSGRAVSRESIPLQSTAVD